MHRFDTQSCHQQICSPCAEHEYLQCDMYKVDQSPARAQTRMMQDSTSRDRCGFQGTLGKGYGRGLHLVVGIKAALAIQGFHGQVVHHSRRKALQRQDRIINCCRPQAYALDPCFSKMNIRSFPHKKLHCFDNRADIVGLVPVS